MITESDRVNAHEFSKFSGENLEIWNELVNAEVHHPELGDGFIQLVEARHNISPLIHVRFYNSGESMCFNNDSFSEGGFTTINIPRKIIATQKNWTQFVNDNPIQHEVETRLRKATGNPNLSLKAPSESNKALVVDARRILADSGLEILADLTLDQQIALESIIDPHSTTLKTKLYCLDSNADLKVRVQLTGFHQLPLLERNAIELLNGIRQISTTQFQRSWRLHEIPDYLGILKIVSGHLGIENKDANSVAVLEAEIVTTVFESAWNRLSQDDKKRIEEAYLNSEVLDPFFKDKIRVLGLFGALTAAQVSGFGIYLLATSGLGAITGLIGVTAPFVLYTGLTSLISVAIGPVGWLAAIGYAIYKFDKPKYKALVSVVLFLASARAAKNLVR